MAEDHTAHPSYKKTELLNNVLNETEELIKIFVTNIKTSEKNDASAPRPAGINPRPTLSGSHIRCSMLGVRCSMFAFF
jgi:hypothetical protein